MTLFRDRSLLEFGIGTFLLTFATMVAYEDLPSVPNPVASLFLLGRATAARPGSCIADVRCEMRGKVDARICVACSGEEGFESL